MGFLSLKFIDFTLLLEVSSSSGSLVSRKATMLKYVSYLIWHPISVF